MGALRVSDGSEVTVYTKCAGSAAAGSSSPLLEAHGPGYGHPPVLLPPAIIDDVGDDEGLDDPDHLLALADQDVSLAQFADDLFGTITFLQHAGPLLESA
jgi:hypothetical protein